MTVVVRNQNDCESTWLIAIGMVMDVRNLNYRVCNDQNDCGCTRPE